jgi:hypothetical protein
MNAERSKQIERELSVAAGVDDEVGLNLLGGTIGVKARDARDTHAILRSYQPLCMAALVSRNVSNRQKVSSHNGLKQRARHAERRETEIPFWERFIAGILPLRCSRNLEPLCTGHDKILLESREE